MAVFYSRGDLFCAKCGIAINRKDIPVVTRRGKDGRLLHECGYATRPKSRQHHNVEATKNHARLHRQIILKHSLKKDILLNKEKLEKALSYE